MSTCCREQTKGTPLLSLFGAPNRCDDSMLLWLRLAAKYLQVYSTRPQPIRVRGTYIYIYTRFAYGALRRLWSPSKVEFEAVQWFRRKIGTPKWFLGLDSSKQWFRGAQARPKWLWGQSLWHLYISGMPKRAPKWHWGHHSDFWPQLYISGWSFVRPICSGVRLRSVFKCPSGTRMHAPGCTRAPFSSAQVALEYTWAVFRPPRWRWSAPAQHVERPSGSGVHLRSVFERLAKAVALLRLRAERRIYLYIYIYIYIYIWTNTIPVQTMLFRMICWQEGKSSFQIGW